MTNLTKRLTELQGQAPTRAEPIHPDSGFTLWDVDARQWIPFYGEYQAKKDQKKGKPSLLGDTSNVTRDTMGFLYHLTCYAGAAIGFAYLIDALTK